MSQYVPIMSYLVVDCRYYYLLLELSSSLSNLLTDYMQEMFHCAIFELTALKPCSFDNLLYTI